MNYKNYIEAIERRNKKMAALRRGGLTYKGIGAMFGVTRQRAEQIIHRLEERGLDKIKKQEYN